MFAGGQSGNIQIVDLCSGFKLHKPFVVNGGVVNSLVAFENLLLVGSSNGIMSVCDNDLR